MTRRAAVVAVVAVLVLGLLVVGLYLILRPGGTATDAAPAPGGQQASGDPTRAVPTRGIVLATCGERLLPGGATAATVTLRSVDPDTGRTLTDLTVELPELVEPTFNCGMIPRQLVRLAYRQMFARDYARLAVTISNRRDASVHVGLVDVASGRLEDLTGQRPAFGPAPQDTSAVFDPSTGELWYQSGVSRHVLSRNLATGKVSDHGGDGYQEGGSFFLAPRGGWVLPGPAKLVQNPLVVPSPSGAVTAAYESPNLSLWRPGESLSVDSVAADQFSGSHQVRAELALECAAESWVDNRRLLCRKGTVRARVTDLVLLTFSQGYRAVSARLVTPHSDRFNMSPSPSPDRREIAFVSVQGRTTSLFRQSLEPGAQPRKVANLPTAMAVLEWRQ